MIIQVGGLLVPTPPQMAFSEIYWAFPVTVLIWPWSGGGGARPWPSGAGGEVSGVGPGTLGTPGPMEPGSLKGLQVQRHWLRRKRHLARAWRRRRQRATLARPDQAMARQHIFENDG